jgi:hypothetical protein
VTTPLERRSRPSCVIGYGAMEHTDGAKEQVEMTGAQAAEQQAREREALRRRVRESLVRCPETNVSHQR